MVTKKQILPTILLLLCAFRSFSQVYDQKLEQHKVKTKDALFQLIAAIGDRISDATLTPEEQQQLLDPIVGYAHKEQPIFLQLRKRYLRQAPAPPVELSGLPFHRVKNDDIIKAMGDPRFMTITLLQCYRPAEMGSVVNGMFLADIYQATGTGVNEASIAYTFGRQIFAKNIQDDEWQIWLANRAYVFRFSLDLNTMTVSDPEYTVPNIPAPFNENVNEIGKNAMVGFRHYTLGNENTEIRRIRSQGYSLAFEYNWNVKNGSFSNLKVFTRQVEPTPPTAVN